MFVGSMVAAGLLLMAVHWIRLSDWGSRPIDIEQLPAGNYRYEIDVNSATWVEWAQFEGVGETLARRIVADREARGAFETVDDLLRVKGLGRKRLETIRDHLRIQYASRPYVENAAAEFRSLDPDEADSEGRGADAVDDFAREP